MMKQKEKQQFTHVKLLPVPEAQTSNKDSSYKLSENGSSSFDQKEEKTHLFAHTILPRTESKRKLFEETEQIAQKTIIVPVEDKPEGNKMDECVSPLFKNKFKSK